MMSIALVPLDILASHFEIFPDDTLYIRGLFRSNCFEIQPQDGSELAHGILRRVSAEITQRAQVYPKNGGV